MDHRLYKFARLVEVGSFTRAARELHISQPALSIAIDKLEQELGAELLIRGNRRLEITEAGKAAYKAALEHQNVQDSLRSHLNRLAHKRPSVSIGMTDSVAAVVCKTSAFDELDAAAHVTVVVNNSRYLREAVESRQLDVAFVVDDGLDYPTLEKTDAGQEKLLFVCHPDLLETVHNGLRQGRLDNFISYDKPSTTYRHVQHTLQANGIKPRVTLYSTSPDVMLQMVLRGKGVAVLPKYFVQRLVRSGKLVIVVEGDESLTVSRPICQIQLIGRSLPTELQEFVSDYC